MDAYAAHAAATSAASLLQAIPLLFAPRLIVTLLSPEVRDPTSLEIYFARSLALALFFVSGASLLLSGLLPLSSPTSYEPTSSPSTNPYASPTALLLSLHSAATAFYMYGVYSALGSFGFAVGVAQGGGLAAWGLWCVMFGGGGHKSRRTGADKRVSGWPFVNAEAKKKKDGRAKRA